jgi:hypothetical protein
LEFINIGILSLKGFTNTLPTLIMIKVIHTIIYSDKWHAYSTFNRRGFIHKKVNHLENFINPITGVETLPLETPWWYVKNK